MPPAERRVLDAPLTPEVLERIDVITGFPEVDAFDPDGEWTHTYLVWTNHGYDRGNIDAGYLTISRSPTPDGGISLDVVTEIALLDGIGARTAARIDCRADDLTPPVSWVLDSTFTGPSGEDLPDQNTRQSSTVSDGRLTVDIDGRTSTTSLREPTTGDWCLFDAVQRLPRDEGRAHSCAVLERMLALKANQVLRFRGGQSQKAGGHELTCFSRIGAATLPTEYWLDERGRLVVVVAYNMIYLLSDTAVDTFHETMTRQRAGATRKAG